MEALFIFGFAGIIIWIVRLQNKIRALEVRQDELVYAVAEKINEVLPQHKKIGKSVKNEASATTQENAPVCEESTQFSVKSTDSVVKPRDGEPEKSSFSFEDFLGRKFFAILGALSVVLAIGFFTAWAFSNNLIGPKGRIAIGIIFSLIILVAGDILRTREESLFSNKKFRFFDKLSATGVAGLILVIFIARYHYHFLTASQSLLACVLSVGTGVFLALRYDSRFLGDFAIIGGLLAPILTVSETPSALGLLVYLSVLSAASFVIALKKSWPEILGILLLGVIGFETAIFVSQYIFPEIKEYLEITPLSPLVFLGFIYLLHILLGSGGIIRHIIARTNTKNYWEVFEFILFIISVFSANVLAGLLFENQQWEHFGFFVLLQGFLFFGLSEVFKNLQLNLYRYLSISATLFSILFATAWETGEDLDVIRALLFLAEGVLFLFAAKKLNEPIFSFFGKMALLGAFVNIVDIHDFAAATFLSAFFISTAIYSFEKSNRSWDHIWNGVAGILIISGLFFWNFEHFEHQLFPGIKFLVFLFPVLFGVGLSYSVLVGAPASSRILGIIILGIINAIFWINAPSGNPYWHDPLLSLGLVLLGNFAVLASFFIENIEASEYTKKIAIISLLGVSTVSVLCYAENFLDEPIRSIFWILWGGVLLGLGFKNNWRFFRYFGMGMFCFLIAKWYLMDVWKFEIYIRFLAFSALGVALLGISFLYSRKKK